MTRRRIHVAHCRNIQIKEYRIVSDSLSPEGGHDLDDVLQARFVMETHFEVAMRHVGLHGERERLCTKRRVRRGITEVD